MAKWASSNMLDNGPAYLKANGSQMLLLKAYAAGDSYATVTANAIGSVAMASGDYTLSSSGSNRVLTTAAGKTSNASAGSGATPNLHIAFTDGAANVIYVTDETTDQVITSGNPINWPQLTYTSNQPT